MELGMCLSTMYLVQWNFAFIFDFLSVNYDNFVSFLDFRLH